MVKNLSLRFVTTMMIVSPQCKLWADNLEFDIYTTSTAQEYTLSENEEDGIAVERRRGLRIIDNFVRVTTNNPLNK